MSDPKCTLCVAFEQGQTTWTHSPEQDITVCSEHWNQIILSASANGPYLNPLPPGKIRLLPSEAQEAMCEPVGLVPTAEPEEQR